MGLHHKKNSIKFELWWRLFLVKWVPAQDHFGKNDNEKYHLSSIICTIFMLNCIEETLISIICIFSTLKSHILIKFILMRDKNIHTFFISILPFDIQVVQGARISIFVILTGYHFKDAYKALNVRDLKLSMLCQIHIFQWVGRLVCVEFQIHSFKFYSKYLSHK